MFWWSRCDNNRVSSFSRSADSTALNVCSMPRVSSSICRVRESRPEEGGRSISRKYVFINVPKYSDDAFWERSIRRLSGPFSKVIEYEIMWLKTWRFLYTANTQYFVSNTFNSVKLIEQMLRKFDFNGYDTYLRPGFLCPFPRDECWSHFLIGSSRDAWIIHLSTKKKTIFQIQRIKSSK